VVHVHDYHTGLIPFMLKHCYAYRTLSSIPTVITIHNAQYQGAMGWEKSHFIPHWDGWHGERSTGRMLSIRLQLALVGLAGYNRKLELP
jgi:hypothetical protein